MPTPLFEILAHRLDASPEDVRQAVERLSQQLHKKVAQSGEVHLPGLGTFTRPAGAAAAESPLVFELDESLSRAVNRHYEGLEVLALSSPPQVLADKETPPPDASPPAPVPTTSLDAHVPEAPPVIPAPEEASSEEAANEEPTFQAEDRPDTTPPPDPPPALPEPAYESSPAQDVDVEPAPEEAAIEEPEDDVLGEPVPLSRKQPSPRLLVPRVPYSVLPGGIFAANHALSATDLEGAAVLPLEPLEAERPPEAPQPAEAPAAPAMQEVPAERSSLAPWPAAALVLLIAAAGAWYFFIRTDEPDVRLSTAPPSTVDTTTAEAASAAPPADTTAIAAADTAQQLPDEPVLAPLGIDAAAEGFTLVVASRTSRDEAEQLVEIFRQRFADAGLPVDIFTGTAGGVQRYRVAVGHYETLNAAAQSRQQYENQFPDAAWPMRLTADSQ